MTPFDLAVYLAMSHCNKNNCEVRAANETSHIQKNYIETHHKLYRGFDDEIRKRRFSVVNQELRGPRPPLEVQANEAIVGTLMDRQKEKLAFENEKVVVVDRKDVETMEGLLRRKCQSFYRQPGYSRVDRVMGVGLQDGKWDPRDDNPHDMVY